MVQRDKIIVKAILLLFLFAWELNCVFSLAERKGTAEISIDKNIKIQLAPGEIYVGGINKVANSVGKAFLFPNLTKQYEALEFAKQNAEYKLLNYKNLPFLKDGNQEKILRISISVYARPTDEYFECLSGSVSDPMHPVYLPRTSMSFCIKQIFSVLNLLSFGIIPQFTEGTVEVEYKVFDGNAEYIYNYYPKYREYKGVIPVLVLGTSRTWVTKNLYTDIYTLLVSETVDDFLADIQKSKLLRN